MQVLLPPGWPRPRGYSNGVAATGRMVFVAGMIGWDEHGVFASHTLAGQARKALQNIVDVLKVAGAQPEHIVRMTWYVTDKRAYVAAYPEIGVAFRELIGVERGGEVPGLLVPNDVGQAADVEAHDGVMFSQGDRQGQADIAQSNDGDFHRGPGEGTLKHSRLGTIGASSASRRA